MKFFYKLSRKLNRWLGARQWKIFALGVPALLAVLALVTVAAIVSGQYRAQMHHRYERLALMSLATHQYEQARVASLRGLADAASQRDRAQWLFYLALALEGLGHTQDVSSLVEAAAPLDHPKDGSVDAHIAVAQELLNSTNLTLETIHSALRQGTNELALKLHLAERHLLAALTLDPESLEANELLGRYYINIQQPEKARERLIKIYAAKPDSALLLAVVADLENDSAGAVQWAQRALTAFEHNLLQTAPQYNPADRLGVVRALAIQRKYTNYKEAIPTGGAAAHVAPEDSPGLWLGIVRLLLLNGKDGSALETLEHQMLVSSNAEYAPVIGDLCANLAQRISPASRGGAATRLRLIQEGLTNAPDQFVLQLLLVQAAHSTNDSNAVAENLLGQYLAKAQGTNAAWWNFVLWTDARVRGDMVTARQYLKTAYQLAPQNPFIVNDMAYLELSSTNRQDWEAALKLINPIVEQNLYAPGLRSTRGFLLAKLGRNQEAAADLEFAQARQPDARQKQVLAQVNAALGIVPEVIAPNVLGQINDLTSQGKYAEALDSVERAMEATPNPAYTSAIGDVCAAWVENLSPNEHAERLRVIQKGLAQAPQNTKLQAFLLAATHWPDEFGANARKILDGLIAAASGEAAAQWHFILGQDAHRNGDLAAARAELQRAYELAPQQRQIQIELAAVLSGGNAGDLEQGLQLIQPVVDEFPDSAEFRNIRGQIFARMGKNREAAEDLAFAAPRLEDPTTTMAARQMLAKVYDALGRPKLAEEQRRLSVP